MSTPINNQPKTADGRARRDAALARGRSRVAADALITRIGRTAALTPPDRARVVEAAVQIPLANTGS